MQKRVHVIFTGGTIAMRTDAQGLLIPASSGVELLEALSPLPTNVLLSTEQLCNVASSHLSESIWMALRDAILRACQMDDVVGVVVVQGTDTIEETAFFLDASLSNAQLHDKPVILTAAMRSAEDLDADGPFNLHHAILTAQDDQARARGAMVLMQARIHAARFVRKMHTTQTDAFQSINHEVMGEIQTTENPSAPAQVIFKQTPCRWLPSISIEHPQQTLPDVEIVSTHIGFKPHILDTYIKSGSSAIVLQALGAGNVNPETAHAIVRALQQGVAVIVCSRSPNGCTEPVYGYEGGGKRLQAAGVVLAGDLPAHKARIWAQLLLSQAGATSQPIKTVADGFSLIPTLKN